MPPEFHQGAASSPSACASRVLPTSLKPTCLPPQVMDQKLSEQRAALERGQNPLPLYLSLNVKENNLETLDFKGTQFLVLPHYPPTHTHTHTRTHTSIPPVHPAGLQRIQTGSSYTECSALGRGAGSDGLMSQAAELAVLAVGVMGMWSRGWVRER